MVKTSSMSTRWVRSTLAGILAKSSNVGMAKIALDLQPRQIWTTLSQLGFGRVTASRFPGESAGVLSNYSGWHKIAVSSLSRGYGIAVTPLQLAQGYATIGALGVARPVSLQRVEEAVPGERVISEANARTLISMLESVCYRWHWHEGCDPGLSRRRQDGHRKEDR